MCSLERQGARRRAGSFADEHLGDTEMLCVLQKKYRLTPPMKAIKSFCTNAKGGVASEGKSEQVDQTYLWSLSFRITFALIVRQRIGGLQPGTRVGPAGTSQVAASSRGKVDGDKSLVLSSCQLCARFVSAV